MWMVLSVHTVNIDKKTREGLASPHGSEALALLMPMLISTIHIHLELLLPTIQTLNEHNKNIKVFSD